MRRPLAAIALAMLAPAVALAAPPVRVAAPLVVHRSAAPTRAAAAPVAARGSGIAGGDLARPAQRGSIGGVHAPAGAINGATIRHKP